MPNSEKLSMVSPELIQHLTQSLIRSQELVPWDLGEFVLREELESLLDALGLLDQRMTQIRLPAKRPRACGAEHVIRDTLERRLFCIKRERLVKPFFQAFTPFVEQRLYIVG